MKDELLYSHSGKINTSSKARMANSKARKARREAAFKARMGKTEKEQTPNVMPRK